MPPEFIIEQGYEMNRPSLIFCRASETTGQMEVEVGGNVILVASGRMII